MRIPLLLGPIRDLATWAHVRWSLLGHLGMSTYVMVGTLRCHCRLSAHSLHWGLLICRRRGIGFQHPLVYHDTHDRQLSMVTTVKQESEGFSKRQIEQAKNAREFQAKVGHPSAQDPKRFR
jgi:hypothetical protein